MEGAPRQCPAPHVQERGCHERLTVTPSAPGELRFILRDAQSPPRRQGPHAAHIQERGTGCRELRELPRVQGAPKRGLEPRAAARGQEAPTPLPA